MTQQLFNYVHQFAGRNPILDGVGLFFADYLIYFLVLGFLFLVLMETGPRRKLYLFAEGALAVILARGIVTELIRHFYYNPRPFEAYGFTPLISESGASFPSGHMTFLFALALVIWYANRKWGSIYFVLSALVGLARIYAGVHWPYDVLGGIVIGLVCALIVHLLLRRTRQALYPRRADLQALGEMVS
jgi:undecaprenyl-diphosphatase